MSEGLHMSRSYSDFMRCLASKYNNSNPNEYRTNNLISLLDSRSSSSYKESVTGEGSSSSSAFTPSSVFPLLNLPLASSFASSGARKEARLTPTESGSGGGGKKEQQQRKDEFSLCGLMQDASTNVQPSLAAGFFSSPNMDMSSTQALLNIVRSASARNNQQQQLDTYFSAAVTTTPTAAASSASKRPAEMMMALTSQTPLDLSASMVKRPYLVEQQPALADSAGRNRLRDFSSRSSRSPAVESDSQYSSMARPSSRFITDVITACYTNAQAAEKNKTAATTTPDKVASLGQLPPSCRLSCAAHSCTPTAAQVREWSVAHVVDFVKSIDLCTEYAQVNNLILTFLLEFDQ